MIVPLSSRSGTYEDAYREVQRLGKALDAQITEAERLRKALSEAVDLLDSARSGLHDPSLRRSWGRRRKALREVAG